MRNVIEIVEADRPEDDMMPLPARLEFMECDTCRAKPGSPVLCAGCLNNRQVIGILQSTKEKTVI